MDWSEHYPSFASEAQADEPNTPRQLTKDVEIVDIGCGFGGLLMALAPLLPESLMLGRCLSIA